MTTPFNLAALNDALAGTEFHNHLQHLPSVTSTSDLATAAAQAGARHGVWIADQQTAGRGRGAHTWHSAPGTPQEPAGLYLTALTTPPVPVQSVLRLSFATATAVQAAIASLYGFRVPGEIDIRWPNDLLLNHRKCAGILIDTASAPASPPTPALLRYAVIGIGINLNHVAFPPELDPIATSIRRELPQPAAPLPREPLAAAILRALATEIHQLAAPSTPRNPESHSTWLRGKRVRVEPRADQPGGYTGTTAGLDPNGFLRVATDDGQLHTVLTGGLREP